jgi:ribonuclease PH
LIEVQATAESQPFERAVFDQLLAMAEQGIAGIRQAQMELIAHSYAPGSKPGAGK